MELTEFAETYFSEHAGRTVPLDLLLAWLSQNHFHGEDEKAVVHSMDLHRWAVKHAENREITLKGTLSADLSREIEKGFIGGISIDVDQPITTDMIASESGPEKRYLRKSSTTGRGHYCPLPPEETCYWSGDPYASHECGF